MKLKLCGLRRPEDIEMTNLAKPDYAGFICAPTRRYVSPSAVRELCAGLDPAIKKVGVFVNEPVGMLVTAAKISGVDVVQLHGDETADYIAALRKRFSGEIWKAVRVRAPEDVKKAELLPADMLLYDSFVPGEYGGTGKRANLAAITCAGPTKPFFLAGGINSENLEEILSETEPFGIDVSSGFETGGVKDGAKLTEFMNTLYTLKGRLK